MSTLPRREHTHKRSIRRFRSLLALTRARRFVSKHPGSHVSETFVGVHVPEFPKNQNSTGSTFPRISFFKSFREHALELLGTR